MKFKVKKKAKKKEIEKMLSSTSSDQKKKSWNFFPSFVLNITPSVVIDIPSSYVLFVSGKKKKSKKWRILLIITPQHTIDCFSLSYFFFKTIFELSLALTEIL